MGSINVEEFEKAKKKIVGVDRQRFGIGTLSEKTVHAIIKNYYEPDSDKHEIPIENYVADIYRNGEIIEIQTRQFDKLRSKLAAFLPEYKVTIVYPIPRIKWLIWIDEESGELSKKRKSTVKGNVYFAFPELYKIKMFLNHPNIKFKFLLMDIEEYKLLNGWSKDRKKGASRYDRIPTELIEEVEIDCVKDFMQLIPYDLPDRFTTRDFSRIAHISMKLSQVTINILYDLGLIKRIGKENRLYLYEVVD